MIRKDFNDLENILICGIFLEEGMPILMDGTDDADFFILWIFGLPSLINFAYWLLPIAHWILPKNEKA